MNVVFPIAGLGTRFANAGFSTLKPFIRVNGIPIIEYAISSIGIPGTYHVITRKLEQHYIDELHEIFARHKIDGRVHIIEKHTSGAAETAALVEKYVDSNEPLICTNCDQYTPWNNEKFLEMTKTGIDAIVTVYDHGDIVLNESSPYSFVKLGEDGYATEFAEKFAISENSLNGIHYWKKGKDFFDSVKCLLEDDTVLQEKYISLTFQYLIKQRKKIGTYRMKNGEFYALGTPSEVEKNKHLLNFSNHNI